MFDHIGLKVRNLDESVRFYSAVLKPLGYVLDESGSGFGPKGAPALWLYEGASTPIHLALTAKDRAAVDAFFDAATKVGAKDNGGPGLRKDYAPTYYAAFVIDPDGNNLEAVCMKSG